MSLLAAGREVRIAVGGLIIADAGRLRRETGSGCDENALRGRLRGASTRNRKSTVKELAVSRRTWDFWGVTRRMW